MVDEFALKWTDFQTETPSTVLQHTEDVIDDLNNHKQAMVVRAVYMMLWVGDI